MKTMRAKDYELIAGAVHRTIRVNEWMERNKVKKQAKYDTMKLVANDLAGTLYGDNPKFDRNKFLIACGISVETSGNNDFSDWVEAYKD